VTVFTRLGQFTVRRRKAILVGAGVVFVLAGVFGGNVAQHLTSGGFEAPGSEAYRANAALGERFGQDQPNFMLLVTAKGGSVDAADVAAVGNALAEELAIEPDVGQVISYWSLGNLETLRSEDGSQALVLARIAGTDDDVDTRAATLRDDYTRDNRVASVDVGGVATVFREVGEQIQTDLTRAESIAFPITLLLLILIFGSLVAAGLPLGVGGLAVLGTFLVLRVMTLFTDVSVYSLNLTTGMGLGLAIDYSLFIVSRYREEIAHGNEPHAAVVRTIETAGRTVVFSSLTVAVSLAALLVFPLVFLRSFAYAGMGVAVVAALGAVVFLPAALAVLGRNVDRFVLFRRKTKPTDQGFWHRVATMVMRRPGVVAVGVIAFLLFLGAPFLHVAFGLPDDRVLPKSAPARQVAEQLRENFDATESMALTVVAPNAAASDAAIDAYATELSTVDATVRVDARTGTYENGVKTADPGPISARFVDENATWLSVVPSGEIDPMSLRGEEWVADVRAVSAPVDVLVGGPSADLKDSKTILFNRVPLAFALIALSTFVLLFLAFGSVLVPIKALVINALSLSATFGAMVWIFQDGHFSGVLDFTATGTLDTSTPILMFCVAFGLSMDYEVFLLSRIKEEYDRTGDNTKSVAVGLERTGRIVSAAAILISVVFLSFATSEVRFIKLFGIGLALAVLMDAFVIRGTLVPAFMQIAGKANWWAPAWMRRIYEWVGLSEIESETALPPCRETLRTGLESLDELGHDLVYVTDDAEVGDREDRCFGILVDRDDVVRALHTDHVLGRTGNTKRDVHLGLHGLAGLTDLLGIRDPTGVDNGA